MKLKWDVWFLGLMSALIGGGSSAVVGGLSGFLMAPQQFNLQDWTGAKKLLVLMGINFIINATLSMFFYLKQSPVPVIATGNTETFTKL